MKRLFIFLCILFVACSKYNSTHIEYFYDTCSINNVFFYSNFSIGYDEVELHLIRKEIYTLYIKEYLIQNAEYPINKDTAIVTNEYYKYTTQEFKNFLKDKDKILRDTTIFNITSNMYCTWSVFDKVCEKCLNE